MEDEAVLDRGASFLKHVCDEEEVEGKRFGLLGRKGAFALVFVCRMGTVGGQGNRMPLVCPVLDPKSD